MGGVRQTAKENNTMRVAVLLAIASAVSCVNQKNKYDAVCRSF
jgi:hypothetical protein